MPEQVKPATATRWLVASRLCADLLSGPSRRLSVAHAGRAAWQLADPESGRVVATLATPATVRLPASLVVDSLPSDPVDVTIGDGVLLLGPEALRPSRWYLPDRPRLPGLLRCVRRSPELSETLARCRGRLGLGPGLTPYGDDVLAGALTTLLAAGHPLGDRWADEVAAAPLERVTTAVSAALLRTAADGWCIPELARLLTALAVGAPAAAEQRAVLAVGSSSGAGLLEGVRSVLTEDAVGAAA